MRPVESLEQALAARAQLVEGESLISRDGYWVGRHFLRVRRAAEADSGVLARGQELERLQLEREEREAALAQLDERLLALRDDQRRQEELREQQRRQGQELARQLGLRVGDSLSLLAPGGAVTPAGVMPRSRVFTVAGVFAAGHYEYDAGLVLMHLEDAAIFFKIGRAHV